MGSGLSKLRHTKGPAATSAAMVEPPATHARPAATALPSTGRCCRRRLDRDGPGLSLPSPPKPPPLGRTRFARAAPLALAPPGKLTQPGPGQFVRWNSRGRGCADGWAAGEPVASRPPMACPAREGTGSGLFKFRQTKRPAATRRRGLSPPPLPPGRLHPRARLQADVLVGDLPELGTAWMTRAGIAVGSSAATDTLWHSRGVVMPLPRAGPPDPSSSACDSGPAKVPATSDSRGAARVEGGDVKRVELSPPPLDGDLLGRARGGRGCKGGSRRGRAGAPAGPRGAVWTGSSGSGTCWASACDQWPSGAAAPLDPVRFMRAARPGAAFPAALVSGAPLARPAVGASGDPGEHC
jgi:hypothetical protein